MNKLNGERRPTYIEDLTEEELKDFAKVYKRYYPMIFKFILKMVEDEDVAEELTQETFVKYYERPELYKDMNYTLKSFLFVCAKTRTITYIRQNNRRREIIKERGFEIMGEDTVLHDFDKNLNAEDEKNALYEAMGKLDEKYKNAIYEIYFNRRSYKEAAEILGVSESNMKILVHRAKEKLGKELKTKGFKEYFMNFLIIGLIVFSLTCSYNMAKKKFFEFQNSYTYNDKSIKVNAEILDKYTNILDALNIKNDGNIKTQYIPTNKDNQDVLEIYDDKFEVRILNDELLDFVVNDVSWIEIDENKVIELDKALYNDEIYETKTVANIGYKMINVIVSDEEYRIYTISPENKLMQIRNMTRNFVNNSVELNRDEISKIVKYEYGEEIEIKSIELTQTKLNVLISEGVKEEYHSGESIENYKNMNLSSKNFNYYLVWKVEVKKKDHIKNEIIYIDVYTGKIVKIDFKM